MAADTAKQCLRKLSVFTYWQRRSQALSARVRIALQNRSRRFRGLGYWGRLLHFRRRAVQAVNAAARLKRLVEFRAGWHLAIAGIRGHAAAAAFTHKMRYHFIVNHVFAFNFYGDLVIIPYKTYPFQYSFVSFG